ncbi:MAG: UbiD family decarboxylase [Candidatus Verstraetearchaeota archaeon]|nr:UbiD family decarboxylase [Candidatus Verstraetearchaeota archaeon]
MDGGRGLSLRPFLKSGSGISGEVLRQDKELSPKFEIPAIMKEHDNGPVLIFNKVRGSDFKVVSGLCGTRERIFRAIGADSHTYYSRIIGATNNPKPPKMVDDGPVMEGQERPDLRRLPVLTHYEKDPGPYITSGIVVARSPDGKFQNASMHRLLVLGKDRLTIRIVPRHLYALHQEAKRQGKDLQVAIVMGVHPAVLVGVNAGPRLGVDELGVANSLLGGNLKLVRCRHVDVKVPAEAEIVLEGLIKRDEVVEEGPFVDLTGTYDIVRKQPVVEITGMMRRRDPLFQAILPGGSEHKLLMGLPKEAKMFEGITKVVPEVRGVRLTLGGSCWFHAVVSIRKQADGDGKNALMAAFGSNPSVKHVVVVDEDIDIDDVNEVEWAIATRFQGDEDMIRIRKARGSTLDPSSDQEKILTTKIGLDATIPWNKPKEKFEKARMPGVK